MPTGFLTGAALSIAVARSIVATGFACLLPTRRESGQGAVVRAVSAVGGYQFQRRTLIVMFPHCARFYGSEIGQPGRSGPSLRHEIVQHVFWRSNSLPPSQRSVHFSLLFMQPRPGLHLQSRFLA